MTSIRPTLLALAVLATWSPASGACRGFGTQLECDLGAGRTVIGTQTAAEPRYARAFRLQPLGTGPPPCPPSPGRPYGRSSSSCRTWAPIRASAGRSATRRTATEPAQASTRRMPSCACATAASSASCPGGRRRRADRRARRWSRAGCAGWPRAPSPRACHPLGGGRRSRRRNSATGTCSDGPGGEDDGALDGVLELAHVARPVVARTARPWSSAGMVSMRLFIRRAKRCTK